MPYYVQHFLEAFEHELYHAFVAYLSGNSQSPYSNTPPGISHLNYGQCHVRRGDLDEAIDGGESGRWFENRLFGGALEFYRDRRDDDEQVGLAHVVDVDDNAWRIDPAAILLLVESPRRFEFPFPVTSHWRRHYSSREGSSETEKPGKYQQRTQFPCKAKYAGRSACQSIDWPESNDRWYIFRQSQASWEGVPVDEEGLAAAQERLRNMTPSSPLWASIHGDAIEPKTTG